MRLHVASDPFAPVLKVVIRTTVHTVTLFYVSEKQSERL